MIALVPSRSTFRPLKSAPAENGPEGFVIFGQAAPYALHGGHCPPWGSLVSVKSVSLSIIWPLLGSKFPMTSLISRGICRGVLCTPMLGVSPQTILVLQPSRMHACVQG